MVHHRSVNDVGKIEPLAGYFDKGPLAVDELAVVCKELSVDGWVSGSSHGLVLVEGKKLQLNAPLHQQCYCKGEALITGGSYLLANSFGSDVDAGWTDIEGGKGGCVGAQEWIFRCITEEGSKGSWYGRRNSGHILVGGGVPSRGQLTISR